MPELIDYKCPRCGGRIEFNSDLQMMKCPYCDSVFPVEDFSDKDSGLSSASTDSSPLSSPSGTYDSADDAMFGVYRCNSCGAEIIADDTTAATHCPYCDNPVILSGRISSELKPDIIIPFKLDKEAAKRALKNHLKDKKLLPRVFSTENHLDEIKGLYVPFWLFDAEAEVNASYNAERHRVWSDSKYQYTETSRYKVDRAGMIRFSNIPADGLKVVDDALSESLEAYDYSEAVEFKSAYLSGYFANRYDVSAEECKERILKRARKSIESEVESTVSGYDSTSINDCRIRYNKLNAKYALLPVWILNTSWNGNRYIFAMNGQTGKFVGNLPTDKLLYWKYRLGYTLAIGGGLALLSYILKTIF